MNFIGIDIGSTTSKLVVMNENKEIIYKDIMPTSWSSVETSNRMKEDLEQNNNFTERFQNSCYRLWESLCFLCR